MANIHQLGGVKETAFYPALSDLLNAVGRSLKPSVFCVIHPHNIGAGLADGGLFTPDQRAAEGEQPVGLPSRGAIEAKAVAEDVYTIARSEQVRTYLGRYRQVLVTTYREFLLVGQSASGHVELLESYSLAPNAPSFWMACALPEATAEEHETRFADYLRRVMLSPAPLDAPRDLARYLASYAREARARVEKAELQALDTVRHALEMALGLTFEGRRGEHFFRSTLVQTLFYGVFASWVLWCREHGERDVYNWHEAAWSLRVPMIRTLFEQVAQPDTLEPLGLVPLLDWAGRALNRVDRAVFFSRFAEHKAVQYFYEPFLEEFDPVLRKQLGVWYTPPEIVRYCYRPFDLRWLYWEPEKKLLDRNRSDYVPHVFSGNVWLSAGQHNRMEDFYQPQITTCLADHHIVESNVGMFPLFLNHVSVQATLFAGEEPAGPTANLSARAQTYLAGSGSSAEDLFYHTIAILHAPTYRAENAGALRQDWPRVPLPGTKEVLVASAALGRQVAALLDPECSVPGVTTGPLRRELAPLGVIARVGGGALNPEAGDLSVRATWGYAGQGGVTMPGKGRAVTRSYTSDERAVIVDGAPDLGLSGEEAMALLGEQTYDLYLNDRAFWCNVPERVWEYTIGGYQALKKWLSYREEALLGRSLHVEEAREFTAIVRRIAALRLLEPALDANYARVTHDTAPLT